MRWTIFWIVAVLAAIWNLFGIWDFSQTLAGNPEYLANAPPGMPEWIQAFPVWRKAVWGLAVVASVLASFALLLRRAMAAPLFWATVALMLVGFAYDVGFAAGMRYYGNFGLAFLLLLVAVEASLALYARWATRQGMLRRP